MVKKRPRPYNVDVRKLSRALKGPDSFLRKEIAMRVLTQAQAAKEYPKRKYEKYDKMILIVGTRKEFKQQLGQQLVLNGKKLQKVQPLIIDGSVFVEPQGTSLDVNKKKEMRLVVWQ